MNKLLILVFVMLLEVFVGIPVLAILALLHADILAMAALIFIMLLVPAVIAMLEMLERRKYPIRVEVSYKQGGSTSGQGEWVCVPDRLGYVDVIGDKGVKTGAKEWRMLETGKMVQNFDYSYVYEKYIWMGRRRVPFAQVVGVMADKGEEFFPVKYDPTLKNYTPVYDGNRGYLLWKIHEWLQQRNKFEDWLKTNLFPLLQTFGNFIIVLFLFLLFLKVGDVANAFSQAADKMSGCYEVLHPANNKTASTGTGIQAGNIAGIPFGVDTTPKG